MLLNVACKALLIRDGKILLLRLGPKGGSNAMVGTFDLPGGRLLPGEEFADVLQRELWEEAGIDLHHEHQADIIPAPLRLPVLVDNLRLPGAKGQGKTYEPAQYIRLFFRLDCRELDIDATALTIGYEHDDYVWVAPADVPELVTFPGIREAIAAVFPK